jgi:hypothetical protein
LKHAAILNLTLHSLPGRKTYTPINGLSA